MNTPSTTRRDFLKGTSCLVIGFSMFPASAAESPRRGRGAAPGGDIDSYLRINADGSITVLTGKMELGQGIRTAVAQIAAEELDVAISRIRVIIADTAQTPNEGYTVASMSIESSGMAIRRAAAEARQVLLQLASERLNIPVDQLQVKDGAVSGSTQRPFVTYWELLGGKRIERKSTGNAPIKTPGQHTVVGKPVPRLEIPDMVTGKPLYVHDIRLPGMLHARILRPPSASAVLKSIPESEIAAMPGIVRIVRDGSFVGVIAQREEQAVAAVDRLRITSKWDETEDYPPFKDLYTHLRSAPHNDSPVRNTGNVENAMKDAAKRVEASYTRPYHMHASIGPSCAVAHLDGDQLTVWSNTQGPYPLRQALAGLLNIPADKIRVIGALGPGCYGHNGSDDAAADAALLAKALPGKPIRLQWSREDEHRFEPYGSVMMFDVKGAVDPSGRIVAWDYMLWSDNHVNRGSFLVSRYLAGGRPPRAGGGFAGGASRNSEPLYEIPNQRIISRAVAGPLRCSSLRGLGAYPNVFAVECFMDELAYAAGQDPVGFRLKHLKDPRAIAVIEAAAKAANWNSKPPPDSGRGFAFARYKNSATYCAVVAELQAIPVQRAFRLTRLTAAVDAGQVINPDGLRNQIEGGMLQSASWTLKEQVVFNRARVASTDWHSYPILSFLESPDTQVVVLDRPKDPPMGAGEASQGPTGAAIANAVFAATNKRVRDLPITPEKVFSTTGDPA